MVSRGCQWEAGLCIAFKDLHNLVLSSFLTLIPFMSYTKPQSSGWALHRCPYVNRSTSSMMSSQPSFCLIGLLLTWHYINILVLLSQVLLSYSVNTPCKGTCFFELILQPCVNLHFKEQLLIKVFTSLKYCLVPYTS